MIDRADPWAAVGKSAAECPPRDYSMSPPRRQTAGGLAAAGAYDCPPVSWPRYVVHLHPWTLLPCLQFATMLFSFLMAQREVKQVQKKLNTSLLEVANTGLNTAMVLAGLGNHAESRDEALKVVAKCVCAPTRDNSAEDEWQPF